jgi:hypothetical protein
MVHYPCQTVCCTPSSFTQQTRDYDYEEFVTALQRLRQYTFDTGIPPGTTEDEGGIFAEVVEKKLN